MAEKLEGKCERCGACCIYFFIYEDRSGGLAELEPVFKQGWTACKYLEYDSKMKTAGCRIYNGNRPKICGRFSCGNCDYATLTALREVAENIGSYFPQQVRQRA